MIYETGVISASDADILSVGRLNSIPYVGTLVLDFSANKADGTNSWALSVQLPNGDVPVDQQLVLANADGTTGVLDERSLVRYSFPAANGGHFTITATLTGTADLTWRAVLTP